MAENTILDLDSMLDATLDAVPEAPDYDNPPDGVYMLGIDDAGIDSYKNKEGEQKSRIKLTYKVVATLETKDTPVADGTLFTETFTATEQGLSFFKKQAKNILNVGSVDGTPLREIFATLKGQEFKARLSSRTSKGKNGTDYTNLRIRPTWADEEDGE